MVLDRITVRNYKNLGEVSGEFSHGINCFIGHNGAGKTNMLDAIFYLSFFRSGSNPVDSQLIRHGEEFFSLEGHYLHDDGRTETVSCTLQQGRHKVCRRNQKAYRHLSEHIGLIPLILVTPQDSLLVDAGSEERRRFLDLVISQYDPMYINALSNYNKALQQRNAMLRSDAAPDVSLMELYEEEMAEFGEAVYEKRNAFITEFIPYFKRVYGIISGEKEEVTINYKSHCQGGSLLDVIRDGRSRDEAIGHSLRGIHRDDIDMQLGGYNVRREGSQGQHKTLVLSMKLAQFEFLRRTVSNATPLLLLDDIFDKLDAGRVENIVSLVAGDEYGQIFITDTNREHLDRILESSQSGYHIFSVEGGRVSLLKDK